MFAVKDTPCHLKLFLRSLSAFDAPGEKENQMNGYQSAATVLVATLTFALAQPLPVQADPPPWAPAHGYRNKDKQKHQRGAVYAPPYGIDRSRCDRDAIGTTIGKAAGGVIDKVIDILIGGTMGGAMDHIDHRCISEILEHAQDNQRIDWQGPTGIDYTMQPGRTWQSSAGVYCRDYQTTATTDGRQQKTSGKACRQSGASWQLTT